MKRRPKSLAAALSYENDDIVLKFQQTFAVPRRQARELFLEMKRWLWLLAKADSRDQLDVLNLDERMLALDEMWHTFILFTPEYHAYCDRYLGGYIHHRPSRVSEVKKSMARRRANPARFQRDMQEAQKRMITFIAEQLGEATVRKWYLDLPRRYPVEYLSERRRPPTV